MDLCHYDRVHRSNGEDPLILGAREGYLNKR